MPRRSSRNILAQLINRQVDDAGGGAPVSDGIQLGYLLDDIRSPKSFYRAEKYPTYGLSAIIPANATLQGIMSIGSVAAQGTLILGAGMHSTTTSRYARFWVSTTRPVITTAVVTPTAFHNTDAPTSMEATPETGVAAGGAIPAGFFILRNFNDNQFWWERPFWVPPGVFFNFQYNVINTAIETSCLIRELREGPIVTAGS